MASEGSSSMQLPSVLEGLGREELGEVLGDLSWHPPSSSGLQVCFSRENIRAAAESRTTGAGDCTQAGFVGTVLYYFWIFLLYTQVCLPFKFSRIRGASTCI